VGPAVKTNPADYPTDEIQCGQDKPRRGPSSPLGAGVVTCGGAARRCNYCDPSGPYSCSWAKPDARGKSTVSVDTRPTTNRLSVISASSAESRDSPTSRRRRDLDTLTL
jgi:hypothetical protein